VEGGGFAGLVKTTEADASELAPADAERLRTLVTETGLFDLVPPDSGSALPDVQSYEITVEDGGRRNTVVLGERDLSPGVRALLDWVRSVPGHHQAMG
jgi:hypothetical protein